MASLDDTYARLAQHGMHQTRAVVAELVLHASDKRALVHAILADLGGLALPPAPLQAYDVEGGS